MRRITSIRSPGHAALAKKGTRVIRAAEGAWLTDSDGEKLLDGMAGLWCVNIGYGRHELAEAAARQMKELPYYNTFFQTSHVPVIELAARNWPQLIPGDLNHTFFASSGSEANDTNMRLVRRYWDLKGKPDKTIFVSPQERLPRLIHGQRRPWAAWRQCTPRAACRSRTSCTSASPTGTPKGGDMAPGRFRSHARPRVGSG